MHPVAVLSQSISIFCGVRCCGKPNGTMTRWSRPEKKARAWQMQNKLHFHHQLEATTDKVERFKRGKAFASAIDRLKSRLDSVFFVLEFSSADSGTKPIRNGRNGTSNKSVRFLFVRVVLPVPRLPINVDRFCFLASFKILVLTRQ